MARNNLCPNPACGTNTTGWGGSATFTRSTSLTGMPRSTGVVVTGSGFVQTPTGAVTPGQVATVSFYIKNNSGSTMASGKQVFVAYTRSVGGDTFPESFNTPALGADGTVNRASFTTAAAPADATGIYLIIDSLTAGVEVTAVLPEISGTLGTYFDGDSPGASWDGTPGNSTSTLADITAVLTVIPAGTAPAGAVAAFVRGDVLSAGPAGALPGGALVALRRGDVLGVRAAVPLVGAGRAATLTELTGSPPCGVIRPSADPVSRPSAPAVARPSNCS